MHGYYMDWIGGSLGLPWIDSYLRSGFPITKDFENHFTVYDRQKIAHWVRERNCI